MPQDHLRDPVARWRGSAGPQGRTRGTSAKGRAGCSSVRQGSSRVPMPATRLLHEVDELRGELWGTRPSLGQCSGRSAPVPQGRDSNCR